MCDKNYYFLNNFIENSGKYSLQSGSNFIYFFISFKLFGFWKSFEIYAIFVKLNEFCTFSEKKSLRQTPKGS
jgi:hypothetical protein